MEQFSKDISSVELPLNTLRIKKIYSTFQFHFNGLKSKRKFLLDTYRKIIEEAKIKEIRKNLS